MEFSRVQAEGNGLSQWHVIMITKITKAKSNTESIGPICNWKNNNGNTSIIQSLFRTISILSAVYINWKYEFSGLSWEIY